MVACCDLGLLVLSLEIKGLFIFGEVHKIMSSVFLGVLDDTLVYICLQILDDNAYALVRQRFSVEISLYLTVFGSWDWHDFVDLDKIGGKRGILVFSCFSGQYG
ncbi:hypothetical protein Scep_020511 [Stephania cephalantha]|uniref:Uncharacterized protein n=1 Tax=Stephania cephalantha TaxID=152367 RepID=A0AAP0ID22_9MAGN